MRLEMKMGISRDHVLWTYDLLMSVRARSDNTESVEALGDLSTLADRLCEEVAVTRFAVASIAAIGACSRLP